MRDWFDKLENKHKLLIIGGLYVATFLFAVISQYAEFFSFFCVGCLIFAIIFTVYYAKNKKSNKDQVSTHQNVTTPQSVSSDISKPAEHPIEKPKISVDVDFPKLDNDFVLRWHYKKDIALAQNLDKVELNDSDIDLVPEPDNQYDPNAVALYKGEFKLGYLYKGQTQEMVLSYFNRDDYLIKTVISLLDRENNKLAVRIAFYRKLDAFQLDTLTVPLTRITKRAEDWGTSRYDNVALAYVDDCVEITENDDGRYTVCDEYGNELGELSSSEKMEEVFGGIIYAKIADIQLTDNDAYKVKISIFYR